MFIPLDPARSKGLPEKPFVSREEWKAKEPTSKEEITDFPVPYLVFMSTYTKQCFSRDECIKRVQDIQKEHMDLGAPDILFNYLVSTNGIVYEGRGGKVKGMKFPPTDKKFSQVSGKCITIAFIDEGGDEAPNKKIIDASFDLPSTLLEKSVISENVEMLWYMPDSDELYSEVTENKTPLDSSDLSYFIQFKIFVQRMICGCISRMCTSCSRFQSMSYEWFPEIEEDDLKDDKVEIHEHPAKVVRREEWGAVDAKEKEHFPEFPLPYIVAMHTKTRPCSGKEDCSRAVKEIQTSHMSKGEPDIIYNYLIDSEGYIYIGRGPSTMGMRFLETDRKLSKANDQSLTIAFIGSGGGEPPQKAGEGAASLLCQLFEGRYIDENVKYLWYDKPPEGVPDMRTDQDETRRDPQEEIDELMQSYSNLMVKRLNASNNASLEIDDP